MSRLEIQRGTVADAAALAEFAARTFADTFAADNRPEDLAAHLAASFGVAQQTAELADPDVVTLLARRAGVLVAYAQMRRIAPPACVTQEHAVELRRFYVDRAAHGSGVAAELMAWVHTVARDFGARYLWLGVWERNARAIAFYTKAGFVRVGSHDFFVGPDRQTDHVLVAPIAGAITDRVTLREINADTVRAVTDLVGPPGAAATGGHQRGVARAGAVRARGLVPRDLRGRRTRGLRHALRRIAARRAATRRRRWRSGASWWTGASRAAAWAARQ